MANMIAACTTNASAASATPATTAIRKVSSVIPNPSGLADRVAIGLLAGFHRVVQIFFLTANRFLAAIAPTRRSVLELGAALFQEFRALASLALNVFARFLARLRRE